ncbi:MAG: N-acetyltransferase [Proteobacteria bacterium]|nr:N-acetyltransferase [Pseudomonadota bacterium]
MPDGGEPISVEVKGAIAEIASADWDACAGPDNPFVGHAFLAALEESGAASARTGWRPCHLLARGADGRLLGVAPAYAKSHSFGEYVFDHGWAEAYERAGGSYYPKLQIAIPFTPVSGPRLMVAPGAPAGAVRGALAAAAVEITRRLGLSSAHATFLPRPECERLVEAGWLPRLGYQFHWRNRGYEGFEDFLSALASRKRKTIRKERERARASGAVIRTLRGADIKRRHWDAFHRFYLETVERKWAYAYLNRAFFRRLGEALGDKVVLFLAEVEGEPVAGALNLVGGDTLYGRLWGGRDAPPFLHFEACYYRAIEFAIENRLRRVEAGAQGPHKIQRGYLPVETLSAHWIADQGLRRAVANFLAREREAVAEEMAGLAGLSPYRRAEGESPPDARGD